MDPFLPALAAIVVVLAAAIAMAFRCARRGRAGGEGRVAGATARHEAESEKNRQISRIAHDLSNPLNAMLGMLHLIEENKLPQEEVLPTIRKIQNNARRQKEIINELRKLADKTPG